MILNVIPRINKVDFTGGESYLDLSAIKYTIDEKYGDEEYGIVINAEGVEVISKGDTYITPPDVPHGVVCLEEGSLLDIFTPMRKDFI